MLPDMPAELMKGKEDIYVGWWFKHRVYKPGAIPRNDVDAYEQAYAREGRMDAAFDYYRKILEDIEFNKKQFKNKLPIRLLAVSGETLFRIWETCYGLLRAGEVHGDPRFLAVPAAEMDFAGLESDRTVPVQLNLLMPLSVLG
jgi:hypothetical protein